jgi:hypothetical protein
MEGGPVTLASHMSLYESGLESIISSLIVIV